MDAFLIGAALSRTASQKGLAAFLCRFFRLSHKPCLEYGGLTMTKECQQLELKLQRPWASLMAETVKNLPAMRETWVWSLGGEDPLEKRKAAHSRILAWRIPWTEEPGGYSPGGCLESDTTESLSLSHDLTYASCLLTFWLPCLSLSLSFFLFIFWVGD